MATEKVIVLKGQGLRSEAKANSPITPGHLVDFIISGAGIGEMVVHSTAGGNAPRRFAVDQDFFGKEIDNAYATGDQVQYESMPTGTWVNAFLDIGEQVFKGEPLESAGNGALRLHQPQQSDSNGVMVFGELIKPERIVGYAMEDVDNRGSSNQSRIAVEIA